MKLYPDFRRGCSKFKVTDKKEIISVIKVIEVAIIYYLATEHIVW